MNPRKHRERAAEIFFETFGCPALFVSAQAILALYASGRTTGAPRAYKLWLRCVDISYIRPDVHICVGYI